MFILDWKNITGVHCGSVAIRNVINYFGTDYPEELCFGLGAGMGFFYNKNNESKPSEVIHLRAPNMEPIFFSSTGRDYKWLKEKDSTIAHDRLIENITKGFPVFLQTDLFYLKYYNSSLHFPGHVVVCIGYDKKNKLFYLSDTNFKEIQTASFSQLNNARNSKAEPYPLSYNYFVVKKFTAFRDLKERVELATFKNSFNFLKGQESDRGISSVFAILECANNIKKWNELPDKRDVFKFAYQIIAKRGSKGAGFRFIYEDFLDLAQVYSSKIKRLNLKIDMHEIALGWVSIASLMKQIYIKGNNLNLIKLENRLTDIYSKEFNFHMKVLDEFSNKN